MGKGIDLRLWTRDLPKIVAGTRPEDLPIREEVRDLERRFEKLSLLCRAMWTLVQERTGLTEEEIARRAVEIDLLDGKADGKVSVKASMCVSRNRTVAPRHARCIYCGAEKRVDSVFETV
jgi:hypothetical protein